MQNNNTVRLNKHDFLMFSLEEVIAAQTQLLYFRFNEPLGAEEIREAMRYMLTIYPKLRSIVEPTLLSWRFRIFQDDDRQLEVLFDDAFRVEPDIASNTPAFDQYARNLLNEPFALHARLPLKMRYFPQGPRPILLVSLHHMASDGMSWLHMLHSLRKYLNGEKAPLLQLESPSMFPGIVKKPYTTILKQLWHSYKIISGIAQENKGDRLITPTSRPADFWGPVGLYTSIIPLTALKRASKKLGYGINTLHMTALAMACSRGPGREKGNVINITVSIDLRPFMGDTKPVWGNFVHVFPLRIPRKYWDNPREMMRVIQEQMQEWVERYRNKEMVYPLFIEKLCTLVGKKYYAWGARITRKKGLVNMSFAYTTLGKAVEDVNQGAQRARICEVRSIAPQYGLFFSSFSVDENICNTISYPDAEYNHDEIVAFYHAYEKALDELMALSSDQTIA